SPAAIQDDVDWDTESDSTPISTDEPSSKATTAATPTNAATLKKMKKPVLVQLAKLRKVSSSGTKADIITRLLA
ncbi:MAG: SAP domain-containing protein, partial [Candidatus Poseidoniales archaeon]|nr:SAP domain-containing protein [Candidatus Poseidoniales archaeon]